MLKSKSLALPGRLFDQVMELAAKRDCSFCDVVIVAVSKYLREVEV